MRAFLLRFALPCGVVLALVLPSLAAAQGAFTRVPVTLPQGVTYQAVSPADYDADGDMDLLVVRADTAAGHTNDFFPELYRNDGESGGTFTFTRAPFPALPFSAASPSGVSLSWTDFDNDGDLDALVATSRGTKLYLNSGTGTFAAASGLDLPAYYESWTYYFAEPRSAAWADYDNDGDLDLALPETSNTYPDTTRLVLYTSAADTLARAATVFPVVGNDLDLRWGDIENDGDLDLLYFSGGTPCESGPNSPNGECLILYENTAGTLAPRALDFPEIEGGAADLGDFDLDGDLDVLLVGSVHVPADTSVRARAIVYRNDGATFAADTLQFPVDFDEIFHHLTSGRWADYDSDGDMDLVIGGNLGYDPEPGEEFGGVVFLFANDGGTFSLAATIPASALYGTLTWADFDADGDLDLLTTGDRLENTVGNQYEWVYFARLFRNGEPEDNAAPSSPGALHADPTPDGTVALSWGPASDDHTAADALTYNLRVRAVIGSDIVSPLARPGGERLVPEAGNVSLNTTWTLQGLAPGTYYWTVQAIDNAFNGGAFAPQGQFTVGAVTAGEGAAAPAELAFRGVAPNPATETAALQFDLPAAAEVGARVYDALGREVLVVTRRAVEAGAGRSLALDVSGLPAGTYLVRLESQRGDTVERRTARLTVAR